MKISARNLIKGTISSINHGVVNTEVMLEIGDGQQLTSVITKSSAEKLELEIGKPVYAVIKASNVMLALD